MPDTTRLASAARVAWTRFMWLLVLVPILGVSAYSLYFVGRHFGVPPVIAMAISTCFDGACIVSADYSLKYAQAGMSGGFPRFFVRVCALVSAFLQTFHARIGHELPGAWIMWAALPIIAVCLYETHIRFERRKALARSGTVYPAPLPHFGAAGWVLFPLSTLNQLRDITKARGDALLTASRAAVTDFAREASRIRPTLEALKPEKTVSGEVIEPDAEPAAKPAARPASKVVGEDVVQEHRQRREGRTEWQMRHSPTIHMRQWLRENGYPVGERGRITQDLKQKYEEAVGGE